MEKLLSQSKILEVEPLCLRASGAKITQIDILKPQLTEALKLYVSNNSIMTFEKISQFKSLEVFLISYNLITYIEDLQPLSTLPNLKVLNIEGNPVCHLPLFMIHILYLCPILEEIDGKSVNSLFLKKKYSREAMENIITTEERILHALVMAEIISEKLLSVPPDAVESVEDVLNAKYPPELLKQRYNVIRKKCRNMKTLQYLAHLRELLIKSHEKLVARASKGNFPIELIEEHKRLINSLTDLDNLLLLNDEVDHLSQVACEYVELSSEEKRSNQFSQRSLNELNDLNNELDNENKSDLNKHEEEEEAANSSDDSCNSDQLLNEYDNDSKEIQISSDAILTCSLISLSSYFAKWKLKCKKKSGKKNPTISFIELSRKLEEVSQEYDNIVRLNQSSPIKCATENRQLMRTIDNQKEINEKCSDRVKQMTSECKTKEKYS